MIVDGIAYGHAVQSTKDKSQFGNGNTRGGTSWTLALTCAVIAGLILYFMFGELIGILWYPSILIDYG